MPRVRADLRFDRPAGGGRLARIVSGGQTGVDRAALDVALALGIACGGWCPWGRRAEDGMIAPGYPLRETTTPVYAQRTAWNVRDSDATLVLLRGHAAGGTHATLRAARWRRRPCRVVDLDRRSQPDATARWLAAQRVRVLNVAGPRESESPGIHAAAAGFLRTLFRAAGDRRLTSPGERRQSAVAAPHTLSRGGASGKPRNGLCHI